jgi:hypothetical protein
MSHRTAGRGLLLAAALLAGPAAADTVITGRSAQALRCAAYIGMGAQYGYMEGVFSEADRARMAMWSMSVLERWVPLDGAHLLAAYETTLGELRSADETYARILLHADWCMREFTPAS